MADEGKDEGSFCLVENFNGYIKFYVVRSKEEPPLPLPPLQHPFHHLISHKDVVLDEEKKLWVRIYMPPKSTPNQRFPVILYFHGGGFCFYSPATPAIHRLCLKWAYDLSAVIVSVNYRLAPEHCLPAAYDDSIAALQWLHSQSTGQVQKDPWLDSNVVDYSMLFVAGESSGGNIAHRLGMWTANPSNGTLPIKGMILIYPFFGGEGRTVSEADVPGEKVFTVEMSDVLWRFALPLGSSRDHPYCNPLNDLRLKLPPMLFVIAGKDILRKRLLDYCKELTNRGESVEMKVFEEEDHGFVLMKMDDSKSAEVVQSISDFIKPKCSS